MTQKQMVLAVVAVAAVATAGAFAVKSDAAVKAAERNLSYSYTRALDDLRDSIRNVEITLNKSVYANTPTQQNGLAARLMRETSLAKGALAVLPIDDDSLENVSKYISQVGDFSMTLSGKISGGGTINDEEYAAMESLSGYAQKLNEGLSNVEPDFEAGLTDQFQETAEDFTDFPSLIYDGPFSDHIGRQAPKYLEGKEELPQGNAQAAAAEFLGVPFDKMTHAQDTYGGLPCYNFSMETASVTVSKQGGVVVSMVNSREITYEEISVDEAKETAKTFLSARGLGQMSDTYYIQHDGMVTFNFAYEQDGVLYYPDLIKVSVALDNNEVVEYNAAGFVMNHATRGLPDPQLSVEEAQEKVSSHLEVTGSKRVLVPTAGLLEVQCWEFACTGKEGDQVLVYINAETGFEEQILILEQGDLGTLVK